MKYFFRFFLIVLSIHFFGISAAALHSGSEGDVSYQDIYKIGIVNINPKLDIVIKGFKQGLEELGYVDGKNISYFYSGSRIHKKDISSSIDDLIHKDIDLLFTITTPVSKEAVRAVKGSDIPIVFGSVYDPVKSGLVKTLTRPGGNVTGIQVGGNAAKTLDWLITILPGTKHLFVPFCNDTGAAPQSLADLKNAAQKLHIKLTVTEVNTGDKLKALLHTMPNDIDGIFMLNSILFVSNIDMFLEVAKKNNIVLASGVGHKSGIPISYGQNRFRSGKQAARLAHKILRGVSPSDLPVEKAELFLRINLRSSRAIGLDIPEDIIELANEVIR